MIYDQYTQTRYCPHCGKPVEPGSIFCTSCGARLDVFDDANATMRSQKVETSHQSNNYSNNHSGYAIGKSKY
jgi:uncharacterized Zn finger protein (UPF0148 family)